MGIEKNAVEIAKQMQRLKGIDGDYDSDSAASNRLAQRRTIQNLERNRQKKRAIGTLDVAFKKRFFALAGEDDAPGGQNDGNGSQKLNVNQTPILGAKLPMRRETLKAIEQQARDNFIVTGYLEEDRPWMDDINDPVEDQYDVILGFNEPNRPDHSDLPPEVAAGAWIELQNLYPHKTLASP